MSDFRFSEKSLDFIFFDSKIDVLEGTARSSKTTSALFKLGLKINLSKHNQHFLAATNSVVARRNLIDSKNGFLDLFKGHVRNGTDTKKGNHLIFTDSRGEEKIIYILGYEDKARWKDVLGSTMGCGLIDEINAADIDFVNEVFRSFASIDDYYLATTLNPDNPDKEIYDYLINRCRPVKKWVSDIPASIIAELKKNKNPRKEAIYWHFNFKDNPIMTTEKIENFKEAYPEDSFYYLSKFLGERGVAEGVIFAKSMMYEYLVKQSEVEEMLKVDDFVKYSIAVDLGNNETKRGTILTFTGITRRYEKVVIFNSYQATKTEALDLAVELVEKISEWLKQVENLGKLDAVWVDGWGAEAIFLGTIRRVMRDYRLGHIPVEKSIKFGKGKADREARMIILMILLNEKRVVVADNKGAKALWDNLKKIVYNPKDNLPLDINQIEMDYYDSFSYTISPYIAEIGGRKIAEHYKNSYENREVS